MSSARRIEPTRRALIAGALAAATPFAARAAAASDLLAQLAAGGHAVLMRHASTTAGTGDPAGFRLEACDSQRNLSPAGRAEAAAFGRRLAGAGVTLDPVLASRWCRCLETARLVAGREPGTAPDALDSFLGERGLAEARTTALRALLAGLPRAGATALLVTHQVNITALAGISARQNEAIVLRLLAGGAFAAAGRLG